MIKIGFDAKRAFHNFRGLGNYSRTLLGGLAQCYPENDYVLYTPPYRHAKAIEWEKRHPALSVRTPNNFFFKKFPALWRSLYLARAIDDEQLDIYHGLTHELPWGIEKTSCRKILTVHDLIFLRFPEWFPWIDRTIYLKKIRHACRRADVIIAICQQTQRDMEEFLGISDKKIRVVYQSIHPRFCQPPSESFIAEVMAKCGVTRPYILFVGALEKRKNVLGLIRAYGKIEPEVEHSMVLVGNGGRYRRQVQELISKLQLADRVKLLSGVDSQMLPALYYGCTLFCYPSLFEGFGLPIVEAAFCQKPVVTSKGSCFPETAGDGAVYVNPTDDEELAHTIKELLQNPEKCRQLAHAGREHAKKFDGKRAAEKLMNVYQDVL